MLPLAISTIVLGVLIVAGTVAASLGALVVTRRMARGRLNDSQDAVGVMFSAVGVLYTVLLAFLVVLVWEQFNSAQERTHEEATIISNLLRDANAFKPPVRRELQGRLIAYAQSVVDDEWDAMAHGDSSPVTSEKYRRVWNAYYDAHPRTDEQHDFYTESIGKLNDLGQARRLRLISSESSIPVIMWVLLVSGGVITIIYLYLFSIGHALLQGLMIGTVTGLLAFILFLILALDHPFAGEVKVTPDAYRDVVALYKSGGYERQG